MLYYRCLQTIRGPTGHCLHIYVCFKMNMVGFCWVLVH